MLGSLSTLYVFKAFPGYKLQEGPFHISYVILSLYFKSIHLSIDSTLYNHHQTNRIRLSTS